MKEPAPQPISPPSMGEPLLSVGIILREDARDACTLTPTHLPYVIAAQGEKLIAEKGEAISIRLEDQQFMCRCGDKKIAIPAVTPLSISPHSSGPENAQPLAPRRGLMIREVVAGRNFHWRKTVDQILPGTFEVHAEGTNLVLVNKLSFEQYCACVITSEMSPECPEAFAQAQATAARSWGYVFLRNKHPGEKFQICNDDDCQRYQGTTNLTEKAITAVQKTSGMFLVNASGSVSPAYYSKSCGGYLEEPQHSFRLTIPELKAHADSPSAATFELQSEQAVQTWLTKPPTNSFCGPETVSESDLKSFLGAVDEHGSYYRWEYAVSRAELSRLVRDKTGNTQVAEIVELRPTSRGTSGRITSLQVLYRTAEGTEGTLDLISQYAIRRALHPSFLLSSAFIHTWEKGASSSADLLRLKGAGWGHGVGLCQIGAVGMAIKGHSYESILKHYFPGCTLSKAY